MKTASIHIEAVSLSFVLLSFLLKEISCLNKPCAMLCYMVIKEFCAQVLAYTEAVTATHLNFVEKFNADTRMKQHIHCGVSESVINFVVAH